MQRRRVLALIGTTALGGCASLNPGREKPPRGTYIEPESDGDDDGGGGSTPTPTPRPGAAFSIADWGTGTADDGTLLVTVTVSNDAQRRERALLAVRVRLDEAATGVTTDGTASDGVPVVEVVKTVDLAPGADAELEYQFSVGDDDWKGIRFEWRTVEK